jgi:bacillithiol synthase
MEKQSVIAPENTSVFSSLFLRYIKGDSVLSPLYQYQANAEGALQFASEQKYTSLDRNGLSIELMKQNEHALFFSEKQKENIGLLKSSNVYTITTGHQLCLFTGPLYFVYKILSVINLAEKLNAMQKTHQFVPVYWMATEDHDFDEINHLHLHDSTLRWNRDSTGAVGELDMSGIAHVIERLKNTLGLSNLSQSWIEAVSKCYLNAKDLATATRQFVNFLFAEYGVIVIDANTAYFKEQFKSILKQDIFQQKSWEAYQSTQTYFQNHHLHAPVLVREINSFYLDKNLRARIEKIDSGFSVVDTEIKFSEKQFETILEQQIHKISPNVILRPVYQQTILPNAAYIGGPSENDYWLQLKNIFDTYNTAFPALIPRQFALLLDAKSVSYLHQMQMRAEDVLLKDDELPKRYLAKSGKSFSLNKESESIQDIYQALILRIRDVDLTLESSSKAELKRLENGLDRLTKKANRALKRKEDVAIKRLLKIKSILMPGGTLQERYNNIMMYDLGTIKQGIAELKSNLNGELGEIMVIEM